MRPLDFRPAHASRARRGGRGRRIAAWAAGAAGLLVLALLAAEISGWPFLQQPLQRALSRASGAPALLEGRFHARLLWRPVLEVQRLRIAGGDDLPVPHLVDAADVRLAWRWRELLAGWRAGTLRLVSLEAAQLDARLLRERDGRASWHLGRRDAAARAPARDAGRGTLPHIGRLQVGRGLVLLDDRLLDTELRIELRGGEGAALPEGGAAAGYTGTVVGHYRALTLDLAVRTAAAMPWIAQAQDAAQDDGAPPPASGAASAAAPDAALVPLRVEGRAGVAQLLFDGAAGALFGARRLQGRLRLAGPSLAEAGQPLGVTLPQTPPFQLEGELGHAGTVWTLRAERAAIGRSLLRGDFRFDTAPSPPRLTGRLHGPRLALADLGPAVGAPLRGAAPAPAARSAARRVLPQRSFDLPSLRAMDADVEMAVDELDLGSRAVAPLSALRTRLRLAGGVLTLQPLQATVAGGRFEGSSRLDASADPARWALDLRFSGIDIAGWLPGMRAAAGEPAPAGRQALKRRRDEARQGGAQPVQSYLTGELGGHVRAAGAGRSTAAILGSLDGRAELTLRDGTLSHLATEALGLDVAQALGVLVRGDRPLPLRCARIDLVVEQGVARTQRAVVDNRDSTLLIGGQVDLRQETLALRVLSRPKDLSPLSLRTPILVTGTLARPQVGIEGRRLAGRLLGAAALGAAVGPLAALLPLVDAGSGRGRDPCAEDAAPPPAPPPSPAPR